MNDLFLSYFTNDTKYCSQEKLDMFFEYQKVIQEDLKRIYRIVEADYSPSDAKEHLLFQLKNVIGDIVHNHFVEHPEMELNISVYDNYLVFSYYALDENSRIILDTPSIVIVTRDMKNLYFVNETFSIFYEDEQNDELNRGYDEITYFKLNQNNVKEFSCTMKDYTADLFLKCFRYTYQMIKELEAIGVERVKKI